MDANHSMTAVYGIISTPTPGCSPTITQSSTQTITATNSVSCNSGTTHKDNSYWRAFNMISFVGSNQYNVTSVSFGVEQATGAGGTQPVTVRLYTNSGGAFPGGTRSQIAASTISVPDSASGTVFTVPLVATVPAGAQLVMEVFTPDGTVAGNLLFIGSNADPESGPSYLSAADCGFPTPTTTAGVGFPSMHVVFNVNGNCGGGPPPSPTPTAPPCGTIIFSENFDGVTAPSLPSGWVATNPIFGDGIFWVTSTTTPYTSPNAAFIPDQTAISDKVLDTPGIAIGSASAQLSFRNNFDTEFSDGTYWDGGVLEVSSPNINGGAFTDVTDPAVGGSFVSGGYTGVIDNTANNPLAGRMAWSGSSFGYTNTVVNLGPNVSGRTIKLRFRMATDEAVSAPGWRIDSLSVVNGCATPTTLGNISTRLRVETGNNVLIGGFIVTGTQPKRVILRAIGPSLSPIFPGTLANPILELRNASGGLIASNDNWRSDQEAEIIATGIPPNDDLESAIVATLPAFSSAYTATVRGANNGTGIGVVEAYDLDRTVDSKLANISTRGLVQTGDNVMIGGLIVLGQSPLRVIVRAIGPSLSVPGALGDPMLELRDGSGNLLASDDDWRDGGQEAEIIATGIPPSNDLESAIVRNLTPGNYTAIVRGFHCATGVALVEAYGLQ